MLKKRIVGARALACALLLSTTILAADFDLHLFDDDDLIAPRLAGAPNAGNDATAGSDSAAGSDTSPPSTPQRDPRPPFSPPHVFPERAYLLDPIVVIDLEFVPTVGGPITEFAAFPMTNGVADDSVQFYLNPQQRITNPFVPKMAPIDPTKQPTFQDKKDEIYEVLDGRLILHWGNSDIQKLAGQLRMTEPKGRVFELKSKDLRGMVKRDDERQRGAVLVSPPPKITRVVSETPERVKAENKRKALDNRKRKLQAEFNREMKEAEAILEGRPIPSRKKAAVKKNPLRYRQQDAAHRMGVTHDLGLTAIGLSPKKVQQKHKIPQSHVRTRHHALHDAGEAAGITKGLIDADHLRKLRKQKAQQKPKGKSKPNLKRRISKADLENQDPTPNVASPKAVNKRQKIGQPG